MQQHSRGKHYADTLKRDARERGMRAHVVSAHEMRLAYALPQKVAGQHRADTQRQTQEQALQDA